ncbi:putative ATP-grasp-modified RiPP [Actinomadura sp. 6N118]|uniref:putative ATP-grasp-modified RiPP n=1 Tax=Actinomadura sp. 6N118 TaxID=3375151 RepID=UPI0037928896
MQDDRPAASRGGPDDGVPRRRGRRRVTPLPYTRVVLDPATQTARFLDASGQVVEMGKHGTNKTKGTGTMSGGGDGDKPQPQTQDDNTTDYESD